MHPMKRNSGSIAVFVGERAVENAATWKSPTTELSPSAWKFGENGRISHFFHRPTTADLLVRFFAARRR
jgi:hypothetical protein